MSNSRYYQAATQLMDPTVRGFNKTGNVAGRSNLRDSGLNYDQFHIGVVVQSHAGAYDAHVRIGRKNPIPCIQIGALNGYTSGFGQTDSQLIQEGSLVLVYKPQAFSDFGIIVSVLAPMYAGKGGSEQASACMVDPEPSAAAFTEKSYKLPLEDAEYWGIVNANAGRVLDLFPGEKATFNEFGVGMALLRLLVQMRASGRAKLEMFCLDDLVRLVSGQWQHFSSLGEEHIYNDGGYVTRERVGSGHQCEVQGLPNYGTNMAVKGEADISEAKACEWKAKKDGMIPHRRFHEFLGHLGGLYQFFVTAPDDSKDPSVYGEQDDKGLLHFALDDSGRVLLRTVSDIRLERCDVIAVPRKNKEPWDPEGDRVDQGFKPRKKEPFKWKQDDHPGTRPLLERDYFAWHRRQTYLRFWELSDLNGMKDWILKEESDAPKPKDKYDIIIENEEDFTEWENRTASLSIRKDGGITMRNSKGSEISLCGDDIILTCPGDIQLRSGKQTIVLAKDDLILKARNSVDITATEHDVRIKAQKNMAQYSGDSMIFEAGEVEGGQSNGGEKAKPPKGIIFRSENNSILFWAKKIQMSFSTELILEGIKGAVSKIFMAAKQFFSISERAIIVAQDTGEPAGLIAQNSGAVLFGSGANVIGKDSANVIRKGQVGVFIDWADIQDDPYQQISQQTSPMKSNYLDTDAWLGEFASEYRDMHGFSYRLENDYGSSDREIYESHWAFVARKSGRPPVKWEERPLRETAPWPGKAMLDTPAMLKELDEETNVDSVTGKPKTFEERKPMGGGFTPVKFNEYKG